MADELKGTKFSSVYNRFLSRITDDLYVELTPEDTLRDIQQLLLNALPYFEFPRKNLFDYKIDTLVIEENEMLYDDFLIGVVWEELNERPPEAPPRVIIDRSVFNNDLTPEEENILAILMMVNWVQRQVTSIENTRMKYSGTDFKMTSQANHLSKLLALLSECKRQSHHMQRLYKRRKLTASGEYRSNWSVLRENTATNNDPYVYDTSN